MMDDEYAKPHDKYVADEKGNIFSIEQLNKRQTERMLELYKKRMKISINKLRHLHHRIYDIIGKKYPKDASFQRAKIDKKISKEAGFVMNDDLRKFHIKIKDAEKQHQEILRHKTFVNMAIVQLENGADHDLILNLLKQTQRSEPE